MDLFDRLNPQPPMKSAPTSAGRGMVERILKHRGWVADRWGNYHHPTKQDRRYKLTQRVLRYEARLSDGTWFRLRSGFYCHLFVQHGCIYGLHA